MGSVPLSGNDPPGSPIPGILQARTLEWVAISFSSIGLLLLSRFSHVRLRMTPETAAHQAPLSMGFFRQEYWSELPFPSLRDFLDPGMEPALLPWAWGISSWVLQQSAAIAPYLGRGVSPHRRPS